MGEKNRSGISLFCWSEYVISYYQLVDCNQRVLPIVFFLFFFFGELYERRGSIRCFFSSYKLNSLAAMAGIAGTTILDYRLQCKMDKRPKWDRFRFVLRKTKFVISSWVIIGERTSERTVWSSRHRGA